MNSLLRTTKTFRTLHFLSRPSTLFISVTLVTVLTIMGWLPLLLVSLAVGITLSAIVTQRSTDKVLNQLLVGLNGLNPTSSLAFITNTVRHRKVFLLGLGTALGLLLLTHGQPAHALFDEAREAATGGIGQYIGEEESTSIIDTLLFGMWTLAAVGGLAAIAGGVSQQVQVLVGGIILFFGMAVLIGILEFTSKLLFATILFTTT